MNTEAEELIKSIKAEIMQLRPTTPIEIGGEQTPGQRETENPDSGWVAFASSFRNEQLALADLCSRAANHLKIQQDVKDKERLAVLEFSLKNLEEIIEGEKRRAEEDKARAEEEKARAAAAAEKKIKEAVKLTKQFVFEKDL